MKRLRLAWQYPRLPLACAVLCAIALSLAAGRMAAATAADGQADVPTEASAARYRAGYRRPRTAPHPAGNARTAARAELGRMLFFDPRLSKSGSMSCATCHDPGLSWGDGRALAIGDGRQKLLRRTPTILNLAWAPALAWDGRADSLEEQARGPIEAEGEMNMKMDLLISRLQFSAGYRRLFDKAYPGEPIAPETMSKAIATFERGIVSADAPFDRWVAGDDLAIPENARRGLVLFNEKARCGVCHSGWRFTDDGFYDIGVVTTDEGRGKVTPFIELTRFAFKTPTLRNVAQRAPYLHNGSAATLSDVIDLYDRGGIAKRPSLSPEIKPLGLTAGEKADLMAFLLTLTSADPRTPAPVLPR